MVARRIFLSIASAGLLFSWLTSPVLAEEQKQAADLLPATTAVYFELAQPAKLIEATLKHPLRQRLEKVQAYRQALESKQYLQFRFALALVETKLGMKWQEALDQLTAGGVYLGVDADSSGVAVMAKSKDADSLAKIRDALLQLARGKKKENPIKSVEYRDVRAYRLGEARLATLDQWLVLTNKDQLGKKLIDNYLDKKSATLAGSASYRQARKTRAAKPTGWAYFDLATLRKAGVGKKILGEKSNNPVAELLLGGILPTLGKTPFATVTLNFDQRRLQLAAAVPHDPEWTGKPRSYYFGADGNGVAPRPLAPRQTLLTVGAYRDISGMWLAKEDLFTEKVVAGMTQADSNLSTFFSGKNFGREVLGAFAPEIQLVAARQDFSQLKTPTPDIKLPGFAVVFRLKEPEKIQRALKVSFQSIVGFANIAGAQKGLPQLEINSESRGDARLVTATYAPEEGRKGTLNYNFSPTIGFSGERFVLSSTAALAGELLEQAGLGDAGNAAPDAKGDANTEARLSVAVLGKVLADNRQHLVAQNVLKKGQSKEEAEKEIDTVLSLAEAVQAASLRLVAGQQDLRLQLDVDFTPTK